MKALKLLSLLICFTFILFITSCVEEDHIMENYPSLTDEKHIIKELTPKELLTKVENKETFIVLLGFPACPWWHCPSRLRCRVPRVRAHAAPSSAS